MLLTVCQQLQTRWELFPKGFPVHADMLVHRYIGLSNNEPIHFFKRAVGQFRGSFNLRRYTSQGKQEEFLPV